MTTTENIFAALDDAVTSMENARATDVKKFHKDGGPAEARSIISKMDAAKLRLQKIA